MIDDRLKSDIIEKISPQKPYKLILFGSHASKKARSESDIDLLVVLNKDEMPKNHKEKTSNYLLISRLLRDINKKVPMDLLVMTKPQWERFMAQDSGFSREVASKGISLI